MVTEDREAPPRILEKGTRLALDGPGDLNPHFDLVRRELGLVPGPQRKAQAMPTGDWPAMDAASTADAPRQSTNGGEGRAGVQEEGWSVCRTLAGRPCRRGLRFRRRWAVAIWRPAVLVVVGVEQMGREKGPPPRPSPWWRGRLVQTVALARRVASAQQQVPDQGS